ncbi:RNA polymerase sigma factor [Roseovarius sp. S1116L3]|uniref:RNA polymerase sigma factor n=1 Tax=Roseovarius roseus TaxID=3342636 RepID=UPI00372A0B52
MTKISEKELRAALVESLPNLWRFALSLAGSRDLAEDLSQRTCLRALERRGQVYDAAGIKPWLITICRSIWYNDLRAQALRRTQSLDTSGRFDPAADILRAEMNILAREVFTSVMTLPEAQRSVVVLVLVEGYAYREAAEILDIPIGTIMSRLSSARAKLGAALSSPKMPTREKGKR